MKTFIHTLREEDYIESYFGRFLKDRIYTMELVSFGDLRKYME